MRKPWIEKWGKGERIGAGGQGETFAVPSKKDPKGVLKVLKSNKKKDPKARRRMFHEVSNLKVLSLAKAKVPAVLDDNIASVEDLETELFFVMEFISGQTLADVISSKAGLSLEHAVRICLSLCGVLKVAIQEDIVHRDLKQENIIVRDLESYDVVVIDFGISSRKEIESITSHSESFQNNLIRLPERTGIGEDKRDLRSDLTDVCAIAYLCLTGEPPRNLKDSRGMPPHRNEQIQPQLKLKTASDTQLHFLNAFFDRGFHQEIDSRFQKIDELTDRLSEILTPPANKDPEPLAIVLARSRELLLRQDKKTIVTEFRSAIESNLDTLEKRVLQKVGDTRPHYVCAMDSSSRNSLNQSFERLFVYYFRVGNHVHQTEFLIEFSFQLQGMECNISRRILEKIDGGYTNMNAPLQNVVAKGEEIIVCRYGAPSEIPVEIIALDALSAVAKAVELLTSKILNSNSQEVVAKSPSIIEQNGRTEKKQESETKPRKKSQTNLLKPTETENDYSLDWPKLVDSLVLKTIAKEGASSFFLQLAKRHGLKPFLEAPRDAYWRSVTCSGATLTERNLSARSWISEERLNQKHLREYEIVIGADLIWKIGPLVERWYRKLENQSSLDVRMKFLYGVGVEREPHKITTNIFNTQLEMLGREQFSFRKQWFTLNEHGNLQMTVWKKFDLIPWAELIATLVQTEVLIIEKKLLAKVAAKFPQY